jgi:hypothetical protein
VYYITKIMAITAAERDVLLKRLELARVAKLKKQDEAKAAKAAKVAPEPAPAPAPEPAPTPEPVSEPIQSPPSAPMVGLKMPEEVSLTGKKKPAKKVCLPVSDDESDEEVAMPKKKGKVTKKEQCYMKLKIYREPTNPQAFQSLLESIHNPPEYEDEEPAPPSEPIPVPFSKPPRVLHSNMKQSIRPMVGADRKLEDARNMALSFFS